MSAIIEAKGLTKRFGDVRALDGLDLVAQSAQVTALLGPNGAGKTTFVRAVATLLRSDSGEIHVSGIDACAQPKRVREIIGLAGQFASVEPRRQLLHVGCQPNRRLVRSLDRHQPGTSTFDHRHVPSLHEKPYR